MQATVSQCAVRCGDVKMHFKVYCVLSSPFPPTPAAFWVCQPNVCVLLPHLFMLLCFPVCASLIFVVCCCHAFLCCCLFRSLPAQCLCCCHASLCCCLCQPVPAWCLYAAATPLCAIVPWYCFAPLCCCHAFMCHCALILLCPTVLLSRLYMPLCLGTALPRCAGVTAFVCGCALVLLCPAVLLSRLYVRSCLSTALPHCAAVTPLCAFVPWYCFALLCCCVLLHAPLARLCSCVLLCAPVPWCYFPPACFCSHHGGI